MIKANELRIGNRLMFGDRQVIVTSLFKTHFNCETNEGITIGNSLQNRFTPIPLTPENLVTILDFEGKYHSSRRYKLIEGTNLTMYFEHGVFSIQDYDWFIQNMPHIQAIHHVQNLIYSLTREELNITL